MSSVLRNTWNVLNTANISYVILRNYNNLLKDNLFDDIDILVAQKDIVRLKSILLQQGYILTHNLPPHLFAITFDERNCQIIKLDIIDRFYFGQKLLVPLPDSYKDNLLNRRITFSDFFIPSPEDEIAILFLHAVCDKPTIHERYKNQLSLLCAKQLDEKYLADVFGEFLNQENAMCLLSAIRRLDWDYVKNVGASAMLNMRHNRRLTSVFISIHALLLIIRRKIFGLRGLTIALLGPDGAGKTSLADSLSHMPLLNASTAYMGRDRFIIPTRRILQKWFGQSDRTGPRTSLSAQNETGILPARLRALPTIEWFRFLHDFLDLALRYFAYVYLPRRKGRFVVCDRYTYDLLACSKKLRQSKLIKWLILSVFPSPDFVFILNAPSDSLFSRKQEHPLEILQTMTQEYLELAKIIPNCRIIDTDRHQEKSVCHIISLTWHRYFGINSKHESQTKHTQSHQPVIIE